MRVVATVSRSAAGTIMRSAPPRSAPSAAPQAGPPPKKQKRVYKKNRDSSRRTGSCYKPKPIPPAWAKPLRCCMPSGAPFRGGASEDLETQRAECRHWMAGAGASASTAVNLCVDGTLRSRVPRFSTLLTCSCACGVC